MSTSVKPDAEELTEATDATFDHPVVPQTSPFTYRYGEDDTKSNFPVIHDSSQPKKSRSSVCSVSPFQFVDPSVQLLTQNRNRP